jgi:hypothetical protein
MTRPLVWSVVPRGAFSGNVGKWASRKPHCRQCALYENNRLPTLPFLAHCGSHALWDVYLANVYGVVPCDAYPINLSTFTWFYSGAGSRLPLAVKPAGINHKCADLDAAGFAWTGPPTCPTREWPWAESHPQLCASGFFVQRFSPRDPAAFAFRHGFASHTEVEVMRVLVHTEVERSGSWYFHARGVPRAAVLIRSCGAGRFTAVYPTCTAPRHSVHSDDTLTPDPVSACSRTHRTGSGIYWNTGHTFVARAGQSAYFGEDTQHNLTALAHAGFDSIQFVMPPATLEFARVEFVDIRGLASQQRGSARCACADSYRAGWDGRQPCRCQNDRDILNCAGGGGGELLRRTPWLQLRAVPSTAKMHSKLTPTTHPALNPPPSPSRETSLACAHLQQLELPRPQPHTVSASPRGHKHAKRRVTAATTAAAAAAAAANKRGAQHYRSGHARVAVLVAGLPRSLLSMPVRSTLHTHVLRAITPPPDMFVGLAVSKREHATSTKLDRTTPPKHAAHTSADALRESVTSAFAPYLSHIALLPTAETYRLSGLRCAPPFSFAHKVLLQWVALDALYKATEALEQRRGAKYEWIMRSRTDVVYLADVPLAPSVSSLSPASVRCVMRSHPQRESTMEGTASKHSPSAYETPRTASAFPIVAHCRTTAALPLSVMVPLTHLLLWCVAVCGCVRVCGRRGCPSVA